MDLILTGRKIDVDTAFDGGLVTGVVETSNLLDPALELHTKWLPIHKAH